jgi:solute:Na+ symporter, SSS family
MQLIDWLIVAAPLAVVLFFALYTNRYVKSVADFLSGGRCAGRYLLANAKGESESGLSNSMARFEMVLVSGFVLGFWDKLSYPVGIVLAISGFVVYRFRETRALTLAQFLEIRYSRKFRLFTGVLAFISGVLNYGIFPAISARFFIYFLDLPQAVHAGPVAVSTFSVLMLVYLTCTVILVQVGGLATMMITCGIEGLLSQLIYVVIASAVFYMVSWRHVVQVVADARPGESLINPFDSGKIQGFNLSFILMGIFIRIYTTMAMQHKQGFNSAAITPHESRMGGVLGEWRSYARTLMLLVVGLCAMAYLRHPDFAVQAAPIHRAIDAIHDGYLQQQMTIPIALRYLLPVGIKGLFCSMMIMGLLSGDGGHLHSWGSILVQDVILPLRKTPMTPRQHIMALRIAVAGVAAFAFFFSTVFTQTQYIELWWLLTAAVFTGGAGAAIIGGLYWSRGTTAAAWAGSLTGCVLSFAGIVIGSYWKFNDQVSGFIAALAAMIVYIAVSFATCREKFNLDRMLHRGVYALEPQAAQPMSLRQRLRMKNLLRFDDNFTRRDKFVAAGMFWYSISMVVINIGVTIWNFTLRRWPLEWWADYWFITAIVVPFVIAGATVIWFTIGGIADMRAFFVAIRTVKRDSRDDGRVVAHHNLVEEPAKLVSP